MKTYFVHDRGAEDLTAFLERLPVKTLGPGFEVRRGQAPPEEGEHIVLYRITIWGTLKIYASIGNEEAWVLTGTTRNGNFSEQYVGALSSIRNVSRDDGNDQR